MTALDIQGDIHTFAQSCRPTFQTGARAPRRAVKEVATRQPRSCNGSLRSCGVHVDMRTSRTR